MKRYLVYDAHCPTCRHLANKLSKSANRKLHIVSIHTSHAQNLLDRAYPTGWEHAPYLIFTDKSKTHAWTGLGMMLRLIKLVGIFQAWIIWREAKYEGANIPISFDRRQFIKTTLGASFAVILSKIFGLKTANANQCWCVTPNCECYYAGTSYDCECRSSACGPCNCDPTPDRVERNTCTCTGCPPFICTTIYCSNYLCDTTSCA